MDEQINKLEELWRETSSYQVDWFQFQDRLRECIDSGEIKNFKCLFCGKINNMEHHHAEHPFISEPKKLIAWYESLIEMKDKFRDEDFKKWKEICDGYEKLLRGDIIVEEKVKAK